ALLILTFIGLIMISGFLYDGGHLYSATLTPEIERERAWQPLSAFVGLVLATVGGAGLAGFPNNAARWLANRILLALANLLPVSKHFHIITSAPNVFFKKLEPTGQLSKQDLDNATTFGTSYINQFNWKQVLDMYSCTECGRCSSHCPATYSGKTLAPRQLLLNLRDYLYEQENQMLTPPPAGGDAAAPAPIGHNRVDES